MSCRLSTLPTGKVSRRPRGTLKRFTASLLRGFQECVVSEWMTSSSILGLMLTLSHKCQHSAAFESGTRASGNWANKMSPPCGAAFFANRPIVPPIIDANPLSLILRFYNKGNAVCFDCLATTLAATTSCIKNLCRQYLAEQFFFPSVPPLAEGILCNHGFLDDEPLIQFSHSAVEVGLILWP